MRVPKSGAEASFAGANRSKIRSTIAVVPMYRTKTVSKASAAPKKPISVSKMFSYWVL